jgi:hypothetical protein
MPSGAELHARCRQVRNCTPDAVRCGSCTPDAAGGERNGKRRRELQKECECKGKLL